MSKKSANKLKKKVERCIELVKKDTTSEIQCVSYSKNVLLGNVGLTTGWDVSNIAELFLSDSITGLQQILVIPGKQYSFAIFTSNEDAKTAVDLLNGKEVHHLETTFYIYLSLIDHIPDTNVCTVKYDNPPGLILIKDFISLEEESDILHIVDWSKDSASVALGSTLKHRQVRHYGYEFKYGSNSVDKENPLKETIPSQLSFVTERIMSQKLMDEEPDQLTVNKYQPGQGIPPHIDTHSSFMTEIISLSTGSDVVMDFRNVTSDQHYAVVLPRRSLCVMKGPSRYIWSHGICPRHTDIIPDTLDQLNLLHRQDRVSFTFRKIRRGECHCDFPTCCDSRLSKKQDETINDNLRDSLSAASLEKTHVLQVYDKIADHFSMTRHKPWPNVLEFVLNLAPGSTLLDVGCGNGKYLGHNNSIKAIGCDTSHKLLEICIDRGFDVVSANCLQLPFKSSFDAAICIAVIHHLASKERRIEAVKEIARVLKKGGQGLIYVWAMEQKRGKKKSSYLKQKKSNLKSSLDPKENCVPQDPVPCNSNDSSESLLVHKNRTEFIEQDMFVPWKIKPQIPNAEKNETCTSNNDPVYHRFYHVFKEGELEELCKSIPQIKIIKSYYDEGNWCILFEKICSLL